MKKYKVLFTDLDGTLIDTISGETFPKGIWDMSIRLYVLDKIKEMKPDYVFIVTNQGGIESGFANKANFQAKLEYVGRAVSEYCGCNCYAMVCETNDKTNPYRKPNVGMLSELCKNHLSNLVYNKSSLLMIGDASGKEGQFSDSDKKTAENFGIDYMNVENFVKCKFDL